MRYVAIGPTQFIMMSNPYVRSLSSCSLFSAKVVLRDLWFKDKCFKAFPHDVDQLLQLSLKVEHTGTRCVSTS